jgi:hypothetical protein
MFLLSPTNRVSALTPKQKPFHEELTSENRAGDFAEQDVVLGHEESFDLDTAGLDTVSSGGSKSKHDERHHQGRLGNPGTKAILGMRDCVTGSSKPANKDEGAINLVLPGIPALLSGESDGHSRSSSTTVFAPIATGLGGSCSIALETGIRTPTHMENEHPIHILLTAIERDTDRGISVPINNLFQGESTETHKVFHDSGISSRPVPYAAPRFLEPKIDNKSRGIDSNVFSEKHMLSKR